MDIQDLDHYYMAKAIKLAKKGKYISMPNPYVGCVIVKNNNIIATGFTQIAGKAHAEVNALDNAQETVENATAYVTLEPCSHTGKTPPCADSLVASGIKRVVIAMLDPNPLVSGRGLKKLVDAGIDVSVGVLEDQARLLNQGFIKRMECNKPFVRVKMAMSLDGKTAMASGESQWITGKEARIDVQRLRAQASAILTGSGTLINDDPSLNVRLQVNDLNIEKGLLKEVLQPLRVVLDTDLKTKATAKLLSLSGNTLIYTCNNEKQKHQALEKTGAEIHACSSSQILLAEVLKDLASRQINEVHVEAGSTLCGALLAEQFVDEIVIYMAPTLLGGEAMSLFNIPQLHKMEDQIKLEIKDIRAIGKDWRITATPCYLVP